jgi:hypothetical protein
MLYVPGVNVLVLLKLIVVLLPGVSGLGLNETVVPAGLPVAVKLIGVENPPVAVVAIAAVAGATDPQARFAAADGENANPLAGAVMVKFALQISKKILPTDSTLILAVVDALFGTVIVSDPSFGVFEINTTGHVKPPSVDNKIFTLAQLTGAKSDPLTVQVTVCVLPEAQVIPVVFGAETPNGPDVPFTVTIISVKIV